MIQIDLEVWEYTFVVHSFFFGGWIKQILQLSSCIVFPYQTDDPLNSSQSFLVEACFPKLFLGVSPKQKPTIMVGIADVR